MIHQNTQRIFDKAERGEYITPEEMRYLENICKPPTAKEWLWIGLGVVIFTTGLYLLTK